MSANLVLKKKKSSNLAKFRAEFAKNRELFLLKSKKGPPKSCLNRTLYVVRSWASDFFLKNKTVKFLR